MKVSALAFLPLIAAEADLFSNAHRDLAGGQYLACPGDLVKFQASVLVDFDGYDTDPNDVTRIDFQTLEALFKDSYNGLSSYLCDEDFREVLQATVERNDDGSKIIRRGGDQYSIRFSVEAQCRGCDPNDTLLFSPPGSYDRTLDETDAGNEYHDAIINEDGTVSEIGHRFAKSSKKGSGKGKGKGGYDDDYYYGKGKGKGGYDDDYYEPGPGSKKSSKKGSKKGSPSKKGPPPPKDPPPPKSGSSKSGSAKENPGKGGGKGGGGGDYCKCDSPHPEYRAPTEEEFRVVYDSAIRDYKDSGYVPPRRGGVSVDLIIRVMETTELRCSDVTEDFSALVSVEFFGDAQAVTEQERTVLEENFVWTYNALQSERCDSPLFRQAVSAEIAMQAKPEEPRVFIYIFRVDGICRGRGCSANLTLFDPPSASDVRMLYYDPEWDQGVAIMGDAGNAECSCPVFTTLTGAPTTDDFEVRFFGIFQELKARGEMPNIGASGDVVELPYGTSAAPTTAPTITGVPGATPAPTITGVPGATPAPTITGVPGGTPAPSISSAPSKNIPRGDTPAPSLSQSPSVGGTTKAPVTVAPVTAAPLASVAPSAAPTGVSSAPTAAGATPAPSANSTTLAPTTVTTAPTTNNATIAPTIAPTTNNETIAPTIAPTTNNATIAPTIAPTTGNETIAPTIAPTTGNATTLAPSQSVAPTSPTANGTTPAPTLSVAPTTANNGTTPAPSQSVAPTTPTTNNGTTPAPTLSAAPSLINGGTPQPTISGQPSSSVAPSQLASGATPPPTISGQPSSSFAPAGNATTTPTISASPTIASTP